MKHNKVPLFEVDLDQIKFTANIPDDVLKPTPLYDLKPQESSLLGDRCPMDAFAPAAWNTRYMPSEYAPRTGRAVEGE